MTTNIRKEGWIVKNGKKRYVILSNKDLTWFNQPLGKVLGSLDLRNYIVESRGIEEGELGEVKSPVKSLKNVTNFVVNKAKDVKNQIKEQRTSSPQKRNTIEEEEVPTFKLRLSPLAKDQGSRSYIFAFYTAAELKEWSDCLKMAKNSLSTKNSSLVVKCGWLEKRGKRRFFVLREGCLYWFHKEQSPTTEFFKDLEYKGYIQLGPGCNFGISSTKENSFTICGVNSATYTLTAKNTTELHEWINAIEISVQDSIKAYRERESKSLKSGWLTREGRARFFVLEGNKLYWYLSETATEIKGSVSLNSCQVIDNYKSQGKLSFVLISSLGKIYELVPKSPQELDSWVNHIQQAIQSSYEDLKHSGSNEIKIQGVLTKDGKKKYFVLMPGVLLWFPDVPGDGSVKARTNFRDVKRNLYDMKHDVMKNPFKDLNIMQSLNFQNMKQQIKEFNVKDLKKLFQDTLGIEPEGNLALAQSVIIIDKHTDTNFILTVRGQQFTLTAKNAEEREIWVYNITNCANEAVLSKSEADPTITPPVEERRGWLKFQGKPRWFLVVNDILMWFSNEQSVSRSMHAEGSTALFACTVSSGKEVTGDICSIILSNEQNKTFIFTAGNKEEAEDWIKSLRGYISKANENSIKRITEGVKSGWLIKNGKKRFFQLRNHFLIWNSDGPILTTVVKGCITVVGCALSPVPDQENTLLIETSIGSRYKLTAETPEDFKSWFEALRSEIELANIESEKTYKIAEKYQQDLLEILCAPNLIVPIVLTKVYQSDELISTMVKLFSFQNLHINFLNHLIYRELVQISQKPDAEQTLFRSDSVATKAIRAFLKRTATEYLIATLGPLIHSVMSNGNSFEIDPKKISVDSIEQNKRQLFMNVSLFLDTIINSANSIPTEVRHFLNNLKMMVGKVYPNSRIKVIGGFMFLRYLCPAMFSPEGFGLTKEIPNEKSRRNLILISKVLMATSNGVLFEKEEFMKDCNPFILENKSRLYEFFDKISTIPYDYELQPKEVPPKEILPLLALIVRHMKNTISQMDAEFENDPRFISLSPTNAQKNRERFARLKEILAEC